MVRKVGAVSLDANVCLVLPGHLVHLVLMENLVLSVQLVKRDSRGRMAFLATQVVNKHISKTFCFVI